LFDNLEILRCPQARIVDKNEITIHHH